MSLLVLFQGGPGSPPPEIIGTLSATETGSDTSSASGDVFVQGTATATETGSDTFAASGVLSSGVSGTLSATETGSDTASATGDVFIAGTLSATESGSDTAALSGDVFIVGTLAATETGSDTASASGDVVVAGSLSVSEAGSDTGASSGSVLVAGSMSATEAVEDTFQASNLEINPQTPANEPIIGGHYGAWWAKKYREMWERKPPTLEEVVEFVLEEPEQAVSVVREIAPAVLEPTVTIEQIQANVALQNVIAKQIIIAAQLRQVEIEQDEDDIETILLMI